MRRYEETCPEGASEAYCRTVEKPLGQRFAGDDVFYQRFLYPRFPRKEYTMTLLTCTDLSVGYEGKVVREHLNFSVAAGDHLYIVGENGSGKSTLMRTLLGLIPPVSGDIVFGDGLKQNEIGWLPQQTEAQKDFPASATEIVLSGCLNRMGLRPFYGKKEKEASASAMARLNITHLARASFRELSGGQRQRVLLARALCAAGKLIMLDEPVAGLDPDAQAGMYDLLDSLNREGLTVVMISHDLSAAKRYATRVLRLHESGSFFGTADEYRAAMERGAFAAERGNA